MFLMLNPWDCSLSWPRSVVSYGRSLHFSSLGPNQCAWSGWRCRTLWVCVWSLLQALYCLTTLATCHQKPTLAAIFNISSDTRRLNILIKRDWRGYCILRHLKRKLHAFVVDTKCYKRFCLVRYYSLSNSYQSSELLTARTFLIRTTSEQIVSLPCSLSSGSSFLSSDITSIWFYLNSFSSCGCLTFVGLCSACFWKVYIYIYIYICIERERERERALL